MSVTGSGRKFFGERFLRRQFLRRRFLGRLYEITRTRAISKNFQVELKHTLCSNVMREAVGYKPLKFYFLRKTTSDAVIRKAANNTRFTRFKGIWRHKAMRSKRETKLLIVSLLAALFVAPAVAAQVPVKPAPAPERLLSDLKSKDASVRRAAANQLGAIRARDATRLLIAALSDKDASAREEAAFALGQIADATATEPLIRALSDSASEVRASAAFALGMIGDRKATDALSKSLEDTEQSVRSSAIAALGLIQDEDAVDELIDMLNDPSFDVRYDAVWALGQIGEPDAIDHIRAALVSLDVLRIGESSREAFQQAVQHSLDILASRDSGIPEPDQSSRPRRVEKARGLPGVVPKSKSYSNAFMPATVRQTVSPAMTERAARARVSGTVGLRALVGVNGRAVRAYVTRRLGYGLDQRAVEAALQYRFDPAMQKGLPQVDWINLEVKF